MSVLPKVFLALAVLAFLLAIVAAFAGPLAGVTGEGYSRACTNLALLAIGVALVWKEEPAGA